MEGTVEPRAEIQTRVEKERGCGWRSPGGLYLVSTGAGIMCGKLPLPIERCPTCGEGIKFSRSWSWLDPRPLFLKVKCTLAKKPERSLVGSGCISGCPLSEGNLPKRAGLLWIGEKFYTPEAFVKEAHEMGISRRISAIPRDFLLGKTWVLCAHRAALKRRRECDPSAVALWPIHKASGLPIPPRGSGIEFEAGVFFERVDVPAIFYAFQPQAIEYVVKEDDKDDKLERLLAQGVTLVRLERDEEK